MSRVRLRSPAPHRHPHSFPTRRSSDLDYSIGSFESGNYSLRVEFCVVNPPPFPTNCGVILQTPFEVDGEATATSVPRSEEHTSELQSRENLVCRLLLEKKKDQAPAMMS